MTSPTQTQREAFEMSFEQIGIAGGLSELGQRLFKAAALAYFEAGTAWKSTPQSPAPAESLEILLSLFRCKGCAGEFVSKDGQLAECHGCRRAWPLSALPTQADLWCDECGGTGEVTTHFEDLDGAEKIEKCRACKATGVRPSTPAAGAALPEGLLRDVLKKACSAVYAWSDWCDDDKAKAPDGDWLNAMEALENACLAALPGSPPSKAEGLPEGLREDLLKPIMEIIGEYEDAPFSSDSYSGNPADWPIYKVAMRILEFVATPPAVPAPAQEAQKGIHGKPN